MLKGKRKSDLLRSVTSPSSTIAVLKRRLQRPHLAMRWNGLIFGVYGFVAYALGKVFFPDASPSVQMIAALGTFLFPS